MKTKEEIAKEKKQHSLISNIAYGLSDIFRMDCFLVIMVLLQIPVVVLLPLSETYLSKSIVELVEKNSSYQRVFLVLTVLTAVIIGLTLFNQFVEAQKERCLFSDMYKLLTRVSNKCMDCRYESIDRPENRVKINKVCEGIWQGQDGYLGALLFTAAVIANVAGLLVYSGLLVQVTPWILVIVAASTLLDWIIGTKINKWNDENYHNWGKLDIEMQYIHNTTGGLRAAKDIRLFHMSDWLDKLFRRHLKERIHWTYRMQLNYYAMGAVNALALLLRDGVAYVYLIALILQDKITLSEFVLYFGLISGFASWCSQIIHKLVGVHKTGIVVENFRSVMELDEEESDHADNVREQKTGEGVSGEFSGEISLKNVSYTYPGEKEATLKNLNVTINLGEKIAIVGANGAGKTTLVKLLCGLYTPSEGEIHVSGQSIQNYDRKEYFSHIAPVFQDTQILPFSVEKNVTFQEKERGNRIAFERCMDLAGLKEKMKSLSQREDTMLVKELNEGGTDLSGGEKQKLMMALVCAVSGYIGIYFSSKIINELAREERDIDQIIKYVVLTVVCTLLCTLLRQAAGQLYDCFRYVIMHKKGAHITAKSSRMDYTDLENPKLSTLRNDVSDQSYGDLIGIPDFIASELDALVRISLAIGLTVKLFQSRAAVRRGLAGIVDSWWGTLLFVCVVLIAVLFCFAANKKKNEKWLDCYTESIKHEKFLNYFNYQIAIARALYKDAPFVVMDEPTAALDPMAEADIYSRLNQMIERKGAIYISHRLSSCHFCNKIAVFDEGRLVQFDTHEELLRNQDGMYATLWNAQAQYYA